MLKNLFDYLSIRLVGIYQGNSSNDADDIYDNI